MTEGETMETSLRERLLHLAYAEIEEAGDALYRDILKVFGSLEAIAHEPPNRIETALRVSPVLASRLGKLSESSRGLERLERELVEEGVRLLLPGEIDYPESLKTRPPFPHMLCVKGDLEAATAGPALSIVGGRQCTPEGQHLAFTAASEAVRRGWTVVSGFAQGIDRAAHRGALESGGRTIFVLPYGILELKHDRAFRRFGDVEGLFRENLVALSHFHPNARWQTEYALRRNRTIAALAPVTLVVEAGLKGGTHSTAGHARKLGRLLCVAEWKEENELRVGNRSLIEKGKGFPVPSESGTAVLETIERLVKAQKPASLDPGENLLSYL